MAKSFIKKFLPRSLLARSLLILVIPVLLIQIITTFMFFDRHWDKMTARLSFGVAGEIAVAASQIETQPREEAQEVLDDLNRYLDMDLVFLPGENLSIPERRHHAWASIVARTLAESMESQVQRPFDIQVDIEDKWVRVGVQLDNGVLRAELPQRRLFSSSAYIFLLWMIGSSIILLAIAIIFMRNQIRPIRRLAIAAERFGKGRDVPFFKLEGAREVRQAAKAFMDMRARIDRQIQQRTAMLAGVSHDLRTPLTRLKLQIEMMPDTSDVKDMKNDIQDMEKMIDAYLQFSKGEGQEQPERTDLNDLISRAAASARKDDALKLDIDFKQDITMMLRPVAFERCMSNLINNASKYSDHIRISAGQDEQFVHIIIEDNGPGIPEEEYEHVFKPFYRIESSRNQKTGGVGLGLPIVQDIVFAHGGSVELGQSSLGGLKVEINLPL